MTGGAQALAGALLLAALAPGAAGAAAPEPAAEADTRGEEWSAWQQEIARARAELDRAGGRREAAEAAVARMRHRKRPRGEAREALLAERDAARAAHAEAEQALEEVVAAARRAGLPPGLLDAERAPAPAAASE